LYWLLRSFLAELLKRQVAISPVSSEEAEDVDVIRARPQRPTPKRIVRASLVSLFVFCFGCSPIYNPWVSDEVSEPDLSMGSWDCWVTDSGEHCEGDVVGWLVALPMELLTTEPLLAEHLIVQLDSDLNQINALLPENSLDLLRSVRLVVELDAMNPLGFYSGGWGEIHLVRAEGYLALEEYSTALLVHELAHAWHHLALGWSDPSIQEAYDEAMEAGLYGSPPPEWLHSAVGDYAGRNSKEYFAVLSSAWFLFSHHSPYDREGLLEHDPVGALVVEAAWDFLE